MNKCLCDVLENDCNLIAENYWLELKICKNNDNYYIEVIGDSKVTFDINYCPKCGRHLKHENES